MPPAGGRGEAQAAQLDGHLLQGGSLRLTLTGDQLRLEDNRETQGQLSTSSLHHFGLRPRVNGSALVWV